MCTFTEVLPATKSSPSNAIQWTPSATEVGAGLLVIDTKRGRDEYLIVTFAAKGGRGFRFAKVTPGTDRSTESYDVFCATPGAGRHDSCHCRGSLLHGYCKHIEAARAIEANEWLPASVPPVAAKKPYVSPDPGADQTVF